MLAGFALAATAGCSLIIPDISHQPVVHNPFPQLSRVAIAPFFNQSDAPTVDGRVFALAYYGELQSVAGFEVVPLGVVEEAIIVNRINLSQPTEVRRLAELLGVDAVVIGAVTDYSPYYPPRCGLRVEWYAANDGFHEIPPGYGLPWGTPDEEYIPAPLVFEAEMALARSQLATQTPSNKQPKTIPTLLPAPEPEATAEQGPSNPFRKQSPAETGENDGGDNSEAPAGGDKSAWANRRGDVRFVHYEEQDATLSSPDEVTTNSAAPLTELLPSPGSESDLPGTIAATDTTGAIAPAVLMPAGWPDERGFIPPGPSPVRPKYVPNDGPIMTHTRIYHGSDSEFTAALASYYEFRDDARFGGWQTYLQRSNDFIRFCCHLHISEMLSARGGAGETRVVWRWPDSR